MKSIRKGIKYIGFLIIGLFLGSLFASAVMGGLDGAKAALRGDKSKAIEAVLIENCDCESIQTFIYSRGIQFSKDDGLSTEKAEYELRNCKYDVLHKEVLRVNQLLADQVEGYNDLDILKLEFVGKEKHETITIKNGIIQ